MPRDDTLKRVQQDLAQGKLGLARDRLHGLLSTRPHDLEVRVLLGDVYHRLGYDADAGRCWILVDQPTETQSAAIDAFIKSCDHNPHAVVKRLKMGLMLGEARERAHREEIVEMVRALVQKRPVPPPSAEPPSRIRPGALEIGCVVLGIVLMLILIVGVFTIASWFVPGKS